MHGAAITAVTSTSAISHAPGRDKPVARLVWHVKHKYGPTVQRALQPIRDAVDPYWNHPAFVKQRKRVKYVFWRAARTVYPLMTGENAPTEVGSYYGTTGIFPLPLTRA